MAGEGIKAGEATGTGRKFTQVSRSYHKGNGALKGSVIDEFWICVDVAGEAGIAEFGIRFNEFSRGDVCARVQVYNDSFAAFEAQAELRSFIREGRCVSPEALRVFLTEAGYADETREEHPSDILRLRREAAAKLTPEERDALGIGEDGMPAESQLSDD